MSEWSQEQTREAFARTYRAHRVQQSDSSLGVRLHLQFAVYSLRLYCT